MIWFNRITNLEINKMKKVDGGWWSRIGKMPQFKTLVLFILEMKNEIQRKEMNDK